MYTPESSETIRNRMLKDIARQWGHPEDSADTAAGFDPLISLLAGAYAKEIEKIGYEIQSSRQRILSRLVDFLTPDVLTGPSPAHAIAQARPVKASYLTRTDDVFFAAHKSKEFFFAPLPDVKLLNINLVYRASGDQLLRVDNSSGEVIRAKVGQALSPNSLWLGLQPDEALESLSGLSFFFRWAAETMQATQLYQWLKLTKWYLGTSELAVHPALLLFPEKKQETLAAGPLAFHAYGDTIAGIARTIQELYQDQFITLTGPEIPWKQQKTPYPAYFEEVFPLEGLAGLTKQLVWLEVRFPAFFPVDVLKRAVCMPNCFPVLNCRMHRKSVQLRESAYLVALESDESFLAVQQVADSENVNYHETPLNNLRNYQGGTYSLRKEGVQKPDQNQAAQSLLRMISVLREESGAFAAFNKKDYLSEKILHLNQEITELEQSVKRQTSKRRATPYLLIKPLTPGIAVHLTYWSTAEADGNMVPAGSLLESDNTAVIQRNSGRLLTTTRGGRDELNTEERIYAYKQALLSRGRIVSMEDIRSYCQAQIGTQTERIEVEKGVEAGPLPEQGLSRVLRVLLVPSVAGKAAGREEWQERCRQLEIQLNALSTGVIPIRVNAQLDQQP